MTVGAWEKDWKAAKKDFETKSDKKKPSKTFLGIRIGSGVEGAFKKMDAGYQAANTANGPDKAKKIAVFAKAVEAAGKEVDKYCLELDKAAAKETDGSEQQALIKILKKQAKAALTQAEGQVVFLENVFKSDGTMDAKQVRSIKVLHALLVGTVKKASLFIAERSQDKSVELFNKGIQGAARDITQNLGNLAKQFADDAEKARELRMCLVPLEAWGNKGRRLDPNATEKELMDELKLLTMSVKRTGAWLKANPPG